MHLELYQKRGSYMSFNYCFLLDHWRICVALDLSFTFWVSICQWVTLEKAWQEIGKNTSAFISQGDPAFIYKEMSKKLWYGLDFHLGPFLALVWKVIMGPKKWFWNKFPHNSKYFGQINRSTHFQSKWAGPPPQNHFMKVKKCKNAYLFNIIWL
jgi:hypothetical protein